MSIIRKPTKNLQPFDVHCGCAVVAITSVIAVIVSYNPDPVLFLRVLASAEKQCHGVLVVDNALGAGLEAVSWSEHLERIDMSGNKGVAAAQNAGMSAAFQRGASHVLLLDHDSVLGNGATAALASAWVEETRAGRRVAAIGANYRDPRRPEALPFIRIEGFRLHRLARNSLPRVVPVSYVISSGCLISREAFTSVGGMNESLFIDYIDIEWGLRALAKGWSSYGALDAILEHSLGETPVTIFGHPYPLHRPLRHYYMVRNAVWLISRPGLPAGWKFAEGWRLIRRSIAYALFAPEPHRHVMSMIQGFVDGLTGRLGEKSGART